MSTKPRSKTSDAKAKKSLRALNTAVEPLAVSDRAVQFEVIPQVCLIADVCRILRLSQSQFFKLMARHELALVEMRRFDRHRRFTGESVARVIRMSAAKRGL